MDKIHILNVNPGSCNIIQHKTEHTTVIDICNGNTENSPKNVFVNYQQKDHPTNPIIYLKDLGIKTIFRFILTHPDMDHMDGIKALFDNFDIWNFWDTKNNKKISEDTNFGKYKKKDWDYYQIIRKNQKDLTVLQLLSGETGCYFNKSSNNTSNGDGIYILAPTQKLQDEANTNEEYNTSSYVLLYISHRNKIIFAGDSEEDTWDYILQQYKQAVTDIDILIAPHHGRKTGGNDNYLDVLKPKMSILGNAPSGELDYDAWNQRKLFHVTHNQAGNIIILSDVDQMQVYCQCESFVKKENPNTLYNRDLNAWFLKKL